MMQEVHMTQEDMWKKTVAESQLEIHTLQMRVKELSDENDNLRKQLGIAIGNQCKCPS